MLTLNRLILRTMRVLFLLSAVNSAQLWAAEEKEQFNPFMLNLQPYEERHSIENTLNSNIQELEFLSADKKSEIILTHLNTKPYFVDINYKIQEAISRTEEGDEVANALFAIFISHIDDVKNLLKGPDAATKFFTNSLMDFQNVAGLKHLIPLYQTLYINYHFEALIEHHFFSRSCISKTLVYMGIRSSSSAEALNALDSIANNLKIKIDPALIGAKAVNDIVSNKGDPHTIIYDHMNNRKMDMKEKVVFLRGAFNHLMAQYCARTFTPFLEYTNMYTSKKRKALDDIEKVAKLICSTEDGLATVNLDDLQIQNFNYLLEEWVKSLDGWFSTACEYKTYFSSFVWPESGAPGLYENDYNDNIK